MASYVYNNDKTQTEGYHYKRTSDEPLDWSSMFSSLLDAEEYAKGKYKKTGELRAKAHDERGLAGASYPGQVITVYENNKICQYIILADRTLQEMDTDGTIDCGELTF